MSSAKGNVRSSGTIAKDRDLCRIQTKIQDVMSLLAKAWEAIEIYRSGESNEQINIDVVIEQLQKSVILLSQAKCSVTYQRRLSILTKFTDPISAKTLLRDNKERLEEASDELEDELFGESFRGKLQSPTKESKQASEYFDTHNKRFKK